VVISIHIYVFYYTVYCDNTVTKTVYKLYFNDELSREITSVYLSSRKRRILFYEFELLIYASVLKFVYIYKF